LFIVIIYSIHNYAIRYTCKNIQIPYRMVTHVLLVSVGLLKLALIMENLMYMPGEDLISVT